MAASHQANEIHAGVRLMICRRCGSVGLPLGRHGVTGATVYVCTACGFRWGVPRRPSNIGREIKAFIAFQKIYIVHGIVVWAIASLLCSPFVAYEPWSVVWSHWMAAPWLVALTVMTGCLLGSALCVGVQIAGALFPRIKAVHIALPLSLAAVVGALEGRLLGDLAALDRLDGLAMRPTLVRTIAGVIFGLLVTPIIIVRSSKASARKGLRPPVPGPQQPQDCRWDFKATPSQPGAAMHSRSQRPAHPANEAVGSSAHSSDWADISSQCTQALYRAAGQQAVQCRIQDPLAEARRLVELYGVDGKPQNWIDYGDIACHLVAVYPPDLAYVILYSIRRLSLKLSYDPVPYILKALEKLGYLLPDNVLLHVPTAAEIQLVLGTPEERSRRAARVLIREISCVPLRHASGIYQTMDRIQKKYVEVELAQFNPRAAAILFRGSSVWVWTKTGFFRWLLQFLFGPDAD